jgi:hypothetical protein
MSNPKLTLEQILESDPFASGANLDLSGYLLPSSTSEEQRSEPFDKDGFNRVDFRESFAAPSVEEMLANPETREELARRDPNFAEQYAQERMEKAATQFRQINPAYLSTDRNYSAIVQEMAKKLLKVDWLDDEAAERALYDAGHWTVEQLSNCYRYLLKAGKLEVPKGTIRTLTEKEKLELIAQIRTGSPEEAVMNYVGWSLGEFGDYSSAAQLLAENAELASHASEFVFWHTRAGTVDAAEYKQFKRERLAGHRILTVKLISDAFDAWKKDSKRSYLFSGQAAETPEPLQFQPQNFEDLSDAEVANLLQRSKQEAARNWRGR